MKTTKHAIALFVAFMMLLTTSVFAFETASEVDFSYGIGATFWSEDLIRVHIDLYGEPGAAGDINTECYLPVYNGDNNQLVDLFYIPISIKNAFSQGEGADGSTGVYKEVRITDTSLVNYRLKVVMLDSTETLQPEGRIVDQQQNPFSSNETTISNADYPKLIEFDGIIPNIPLNLDEELIPVDILDHVFLWEGALDAGYTAEDFSLNSRLYAENGLEEINYNCQGQYCRVTIRIMNDGSYKLWIVEPLEDYNKTVSIKPTNLITANNGNDEVEFYPSDTSETSEVLPLSQSMTVYKNYGIATYSEVVPGHSDTISEYRYVDTDVDGFYDTVFIDYEEVFMIGHINQETYKYYVDTDMMRTYPATSLQLDPSDSYTSYHLNMDRSEIEVGQIVVVKPSYDGPYTHYDVTVQDAQKIYGNVSGVYSDEHNIPWYQIGENKYKMLNTYYGYQLFTGDTILGYVYQDTIVGFEMQISMNANLGIILGSNRNTNFDVDYQLKILDQNGDVSIYNLADQVNGAQPFWPTNDAFTTSFPQGDMIIYELNNQNEIISFDIQSLQTNYLIPETYDFFTGDGSYSESNQKLGRWFLTEETVIFATEGTQEECLQDNTYLADASILSNGTVYQYSALYDENHEAIMVLVYETERPNDEEEDEELNANYGVIVDTNISSVFGSEYYEIKICNQNNEIEIYKLAENVNHETPSWGTEEEFAVDFPKGDLIVYKLNSNNQIVKYDIEKYFGVNDTNVINSDEWLSTGSAKYSKENQTVGSYKLTDSTLIFAKTAHDEYLDVESIFMIEQDQLIDETLYNYTVLQDKDNNIKVLTLETPKILFHSVYPVVITKTAKVTVDTKERTRIFGYVDETEEEFLIALDAEESALALATGDIALFSYYYDKEITTPQIYQATILADKTEEGFVVIDNAMSGAADDCKTNETGNYVTLSTQNYGKIYSYDDAKSAAQGMMTIGTSVSLEGFGAAGKGYTVETKLLRLVNAKNYPNTFGEYEEREYSKQYADDRVNDYYFEYEDSYSRDLAYCYDVKRDRFYPTSVFNTETDQNTFDYQITNQLENDDLIYLYNYDGRTKLILVIDVMGDN